MGVRILEAPCEPLVEERVRREGETGGVRGELKTPEEHRGRPPISEEEAAEVDLERITFMIVLVVLEVVVVCEWVVSWSPLRWGEFPGNKGSLVVL